MDRFFNSLPKTPNLPSFPSKTANSDDNRETHIAAPSAPAPAPAPETKSLPKGVVLGKDGKPCRTCTSVAAWADLVKSKSKSPSSSTSSTSTSTSTSTPTSASSSSSSSSAPSSTALLSPEEIQARCPPDVELLGRSTWTLLHSISAAYPESASPGDQRDMRTFLTLLGKLYPCWPCAADFQHWMADRAHGGAGHAPRVEGRQALGTWMCEAHNEVNRKLGKELFDCAKWEERWRTGGEGCG